MPSKPTLADFANSSEFVKDVLQQRLSHYLATGLEASQPEQVYRQTLTDPVTGAFNLSGWNRILASEQHRCVRYGHHASILSIAIGIEPRQVSRSEHQIARLATFAIFGLLGKHDVLAREESTKFLVLILDKSENEMNLLTARLRGKLMDVSSLVAIGSAARHEDATLVATAADARSRRDLLADAMAS